MFFSGSEGLVFHNIHFFRRLVNQKYHCKRQTATMKIKLSKNLKKIKPFGAGRKGRSDESIAASELLEDHLGMSGSNLDDGEQDGDVDGDDAKNDAASRPTDNAAGAGVDEELAERQGDDDHDDDASESTQARLGRSISYVLREDERKQAKKETRAAVTAGRDEVESSGRPPLPPTQHSHSSSRSSSGSSSSGGGRQREGAATGAAPASADGTKLTRDRSIRSRDESIGSIEILFFQIVPPRVRRSLPGDWTARGCDWRRPDGKKRRSRCWDGRALDGR